MTAEALATSRGLHRLYDAKGASYFSGARADFVARLPADGGAAVLEIGCGSGATGALALARGKAGRYVGIEVCEGAAARAREVLSQVVVGDVERIELPWQPATFDAVILSEVLEHLIEPWAVLEKLHRVVRPGAMVLASSPNVAHWQVLRELAHGRFELADRGVFDRTHLRWFTPDSFAAMFERSGYRVQAVGPVKPFAGKAELLSRWSGGRLDHLLMTQISLEARRR